MGSNPLKGEAIAARLDFTIAEEFVPMDVLIESGSLILVNQVSNSHEKPLWCIEGEMETMRKLLAIKNEWKIAWIARDGNTLAHNIAKWGITSGLLGDIELEAVPQSVLACNDVSKGYGVAH